MKPVVKIHGHRGARGLFPENTITSFIEAVKLGVDGIELDLVISKDLKVVVSHEPWMNHLFCSKPNSKSIKKNELINLYNLNYSQIKKYDCGKRGNKNFPKQKRVAEFKPLLSEVIKKTESFIKTNDLPPVLYNIEIKSEKKGDNIFHPKPKLFSRLVYETIALFHINDRIMIQSFDIRILREIKKINDSINLGLLVKKKSSLESNIRKLGFIPYAYNPNHKLVNKKLVNKAHKMGMKVFVWTVNNVKDMKNLMKQSVDGIITDYPNISKSFIKQ